MKMEPVRCWKVGMNNKLFITYPEGHLGHYLICCKQCGHVHAVNVSATIYIEPDLEKHLRIIKCAGCSNILAGNWAYYPETYIDENNQIQHFERPLQFSDDEDSIIAEFPEVFS